MTIYDIAKHFNVNVSTVSKALNGSNDIKESTRQKISEYAAIYGFKTRRAKQGKGRIAILRGKDGERLQEIASLFKQEAENDNWRPVECEIGDGFDLEAYLAENACSGIFVLGAPYDSLVARQLKTVAIPAVILGNPCDNPHVSNVKSDDLMAVSGAVDRLVSLGHTLIAFIGTDKDSLVGAERFAGYFFGLSKNALPYRYDLTYFSEATAQSGMDAAEYFLSYKKHFTAVVCSSREAARGFSEYMHRADKNVPDDFSVICLEENGSADNTPLTTIVPDFSAMASKAFFALKATMTGFPAQQITVPCTFEPLERSCRPKKKYYPSDAE